MKKHKFKDIVRPTITKVLILSALSFALPLLSETYKDTIESKKRIEFEEQYYSSTDLCILGIYSIHKDKSISFEISKILIKNKEYEKAFEILDLLIQRTERTEKDIYLTYAKLCEKLEYWFKASVIYRELELWEDATRCSKKQFEKIQKEIENGP